MSIPPLVTTGWLAGELAAPDLICFDASYYLPSEQRNAYGEFLRAHLPGARFFDLDAVADVESKLPHMVPTAAQFERMIGALGVANHHRVVCYDQRGMFSAARPWWLLRYFGHEAVAVLDGGLPAWCREERAVESGVSTLPAPELFKARLRTARLRGIGDLLENLESGYERVLDARSPDRFHARVPEPRAGVRGGHIPGSINLPYQELLSVDGSMLSPAALRARFAAVGIGQTTVVVTSCGSGISAALLTLGLSVAGLPEGALYDGSWTEWGGRSDTPIAAD